MKPPVASSSRFARCRALAALAFGVAAACALAATNSTESIGTTDLPAHLPTNSAPAITTTNAPPAAPTGDPLHPFATVPGLRVQQVTRPGQLAEPTALAVDAAGRVLVGERLPGGGGRITRLTDSDGNGVFETNAVWAENLPVPIALVCYGDGAFVAAGGDVLFLKSSGTNSARADVRTVVFSGFASNAPPAALVWGPDQWIHAAVPRANVTLKVNAGTRQSLALGGDDFAFEPRTLAVRREPGGAHTGIALDLAGRRFTTSPRRPLAVTFATAEATVANPYFTWPETEALLLPEKSHPLAGLFLYSGGLLPTNFNGNLLCADATGGVVRRLAIAERALAPAVQIPPGQPDDVLLRAGDPAFRPVAVTATADGALLVADANREPGDGARGPGRLWRVSSAGTAPTRAPDLTQLNTPSLAELLVSPNGWARDTAARLLFEQRDTNTPAFLRRELRFGKSAVARCLALTLLDRLDALSRDELLLGLNDSAPAVRAAALRIARPWLAARRAPPALLAAVQARAGDRSPWVRLQAALTLGAEDQDAGTTDALAQVLRNDADNPWIRSAALAGAFGRADAMLQSLLAQPRFRNSDAAYPILLALAAQAGLQPNLAGDPVLRDLAAARLSRERTFGLAHAFAASLRDAGRSLPAVAPNEWENFASGALDLAVNSGPVNERAAATRYLGVSGYGAPQVADWVLALFVPGEPEAVQLAAVDSLARLEDPLIVSAFLQRWAQSPPAVRRELIGVLLRRPDRTFALLGELEARRIPLTALTSLQADFLRTHPDATTARRAVRLLGGELNRQRGLAGRFAPVVAKQEGVSARGRAIFQSRCAGCHRSGETGQPFGPELDAGAGRSREDWLTDILEPNARIAASHETRVLLRNNGEFLVGLAENEGGSVLRVRQPDGTVRTVRRDHLNESFRAPWSLMPENAAAGLTARELADLLAFLERAP